MKHFWQAIKYFPIFRIMCTHLYIHVYIQYTLPPPPPTHTFVSLGSRSSTPVSVNIEDGRDRRASEATPPVCNVQKFQARKFSIDTIKQKKNIGVNHFNRSVHALVHAWLVCCPRNVQCTCMCTSVVLNRKQLDSPSNWTCFCFENVTCVYCMCTWGPSETAWYWLHSVVDKLSCCAVSRVVMNQRVDGMHTSVYLLVSKLSIQVVF